SREATCATTACACSPIPGHVSFRRKPQRSSHSSVTSKELGMIQVSLRASIVIVALLVGSSPAFGQVMQRRIPRPAPASPAPDSAPTAVAPNAPSPNGCPKDYVGPPLIASVEPLGGTW